MISYLIPLTSLRARKPRICAWMLVAAATLISLKQKIEEKDQSNVQWEFFLVYYFPEKELIQVLCNRERVTE